MFQQFFMRLVFDQYWCTLHFLPQCVVGLNNLYNELPGFVHLQDTPLKGGRPQEGGNIYISEARSPAE